MNILPTHLSKSLSIHLISYIFPKTFCSSFTKNRIYSDIYMYMFHRNFLLTLMKYFSSILVIAVVLLPLFFLWCLLILNSEKPCIDLDFSVQLQLIVIEGRLTRARWILWFDLKPVSFVILISSGMKLCSYEQVKKKRKKEKSPVSFILK